jgi:hypothetical protein
MRDTAKILSALALIAFVFPLTLNGDRPPAAADDFQATPYLAEALPQRRARQPGQEDGPLLRRRGQG